MIKNLRLSKGWSQEQLAQFSGLSVRTIQRIERGHSAGLESLKCVAAVLDVNVSQLSNDLQANNHQFSGAQPILYVKNIIESVDFFENTLRFEIANFDKDSDNATLYREKTFLELRHSDINNAGTSMCSFFVNNITAAYAEISNLTTSIFDTKVDLEGKLIEFSICDNSGNTLIFRKRSY